MARVGLAGAELGLRGNWGACSQGHLEEEPTAVLRYRALEWGDVAELASVLEAGLVGVVGGHSRPAPGFPVGGDAAY